MYALKTLSTSQSLLTRYDSAVTSQCQMDDKFFESLLKGDRVILSAKYLRFGRNQGKAFRRTQRDAIG
jgi:hypothetical protein